MSNVVLGCACPSRPCHSAYIHTLSNEHAGVSVPQAVHVQIVRQIALPQNLFEPECECTRHPRIPAGLPKQIVLFLQPPFTTLFFLPHTFFLPDTKQFAEFFRQIYHPHPRTGLRFFHQDRLAAQFYHIAPDMQHLLSDHCKLHASLRRMLVARLILK